MKSSRYWLLAVCWAGVFGCSAPQAPLVRLERAELFAAAELPPGQALGAKLVPMYRNGDPIGARVLTIDPRGILARFGVQRDDVLRGVNLLQLNDPEYLARIVPKLRDEPEGRIIILRNGNEVAIPYSSR